MSKWIIEFTPSTANLEKSLKMLQHVMEDGGAFFSITGYHGDMHVDFPSHQFTIEELAEVLPEPESKPRRRRKPKIGHWRGKK